MNDEWYSDLFYPLDDKIKKIVDEVMATSSKPILIEIGEDFERENIVKYISNRHTSMVLDNIYGFDINGSDLNKEIMNQYGKIIKQPNWYKEMLRKCNENPDKKIVLFFTNVSNKPNSDVARLSDVLLDDDKIFDIPKNVQIIFTKTYFKPASEKLGYSEYPEFFKPYECSLEREKEIFKDFFEKCTVLRIVDKDNILINPYGSEKLK